MIHTKSVLGRESGKNCIIKKPPYNLCFVDYSTRCSTVTSGAISDPSKTDLGYRLLVSSNYYSCKLAQGCPRLSPYPRRCRIRWSTNALMFSRPFTRLVSLKISIGALDSTLTFLPYFLRKRVLFGEFDHLTRSATVGRGLERWWTV